MESLLRQEAFSSFLVQEILRLSLYLHLEASVSQFTYFNVSFT